MWRRCIVLNKVRLKTFQFRLPPSCLCNLQSFDIFIFMNSRSIVASTVSCNSGNKNSFFWILVCLLPKFLGASIACVNFLLFKAIVRNPSSSRILVSFEGIHP